MTFSIPFIGEFLAIHHRKVGVSNDVLGLRKEEVRELTDLCERWADLLRVMMERALDTNKASGPDAAQAIIRRQQDDFTAIDYHAVREDSDVLKHLRKDDRFKDFVRSCESFYSGALDLKELAIRHFQGSSDLDRAVETWLRRLETLLEAVRREARSVRVIEPI